ncbi:GTPase HflX [Fervidibacillus halotolerans]|uniref:GTPase HflX n=1 Tax=Fervidibacillus halotolerans TaxID=2980027 RepID=A0A9E8LYS6_9BACI|nr:GTPase HflX [Fervidibacillus halotolerans]WAA12064.1 GTPase HflX [Fervidibacillus halotolerans]
MKRKAILVGVNVNRLDMEFEYSMNELKHLAEALKIESVATVTQKLPTIHPSSYIGKGKLEELRILVEEMDPDVIIFDDELSASQISTLESKLNCDVIDRTMLILDIFAERAKTKESQLQVEIARLKYMLPRLVGKGISLSRQGGGAGFRNRGAGETKLELDRRKIENRISQLNKELEKVIQERATQRNLRRKNRLPIVSLVGYTNAGKSTIMNAFIEKYNMGEEKQVLEKNMLFATLETSVRKIRMENNQTFLLTDTVGFINKLPHHLVKAFRSTLEEVVEADVIVHVLDFSDPNYRDHMHLTNQLLEEIGVRDVPIIYAYNKADVTEHSFPKVVGEKVFLSGKKRIGIEELSDVIRKKIFPDTVQCELFIPYAQGEVLSYFYDHAHVLSKDYVEEGTKLLVGCSQSDARFYQKYITR